MVSLHQPHSALVLSQPPFHSLFCLLFLSVFLLIFPLLLLPFFPLSFPPFPLPPFVLLGLPLSVFRGGEELKQRRRLLTSFGGCRPSESQALSSYGVGGRLISSKTGQISTPRPEKRLLDSGFPLTHNLTLSSRPRRPQLADYLAITFRLPQPTGWSV